MSAIALLATHCKTDVTYRVTFAADADAVRYIEARSSSHAFTVEDDFDDEAAPLTTAALFPSCEHGLSAWLCAGPGHYPMDR